MTPSFLHKALLHHLFTFIFGGAYMFICLCAYLCVQICGIHLLWWKPEDSIGHAAFYHALLSPLDSLSLDLKLGLPSDSLVTFSLQRWHVQPH